MVPQKQILLINKNVSDTIFYRSEPIHFYSNYYFASYDDFKLLKKVKITNLLLFSKTNYIGNTSSSSSSLQTIKK